MTVHTRGVGVYVRKPRSDGPRGGRCRECQHPVAARHVGMWCADCEPDAGPCSAGRSAQLPTRYREQVAAGPAPRRTIMDRS
jgi:hypothetical protein